MGYESEIMQMEFGDDWDKIRKDLIRLVEKEKRETQIFGLAVALLSVIFVALV